MGAAPIILDLALIDQGYKIRCNEIMLPIINADGCELTTANVPSCSRPFAVVQKAGNYYLLFEFLLSSVVHAWVLDENARRLSGTNLQIKDLGLDEQDFLGRFGVERKIHSKIFKVEKNQVATDEFSAAEIELANYSLNLSGFSVTNLIKNATENRHVKRFFSLEDIYVGNVTIFDELSKSTTLELRNNVSGLDLASLFSFASTIIKQCTEEIGLSLVDVELGSLTSATDIETVVFNVPSITVENLNDHGKIRLEIQFATSLFHRRTDVGARERAIEHLKKMLPTTLFLIVGFINKCSSGFSINITYSDGGAETSLSFDGGENFKHILPDLYALGEYRNARRHIDVPLEVFREHFRRRNNKCFWRGATTGSYMYSISDLKQNFRVSTCIMLNDYSDIFDCKISRVTQYFGDSKSDAEEFLANCSIFAKMVPEAEFGKYSMYLDLPGNAAAWGTFKKYLQGCVVIRPASSRQLLYYKAQEPWRDYVPVKNDLSDLIEIVQQLVNSPELAASIAFAGRRFMINYLRDLESQALDVMLRYSSFSSNNQLVDEL